MFIYISIMQGGVIMKKNNRKIATLLLLAVVAIGSYFVAGTYAKYTSEIAGSDDASVAKWAWNINGDLVYLILSMKLILLLLRVMLTQI